MSDLNCKSEDQIESSKGHKLFCRYWNGDKTQDSKSPRGLVLICHGFAEHCQLYDGIAEVLVSHGYYVFAHDHVGHGKSEGERAQIQDFMEYTEDVFRHVETVKQRFPDVPVFILGHSMGGTIAIKAALQKPFYFKGLVLISPLISTQQATRARVMVGRMISRILPNLHIGKLDPKQVSRDPEVVKRYTDDPLVYHTGMKSRIAMVILDVLVDLQAKVQDVTVPFLVLHGTKDSICNMEGSQLLFDKAQSKDKQIKLYTDAYHQLHNEIDPVKSEVCKAVADWLNARC